MVIIFVFAYAIFHACGFVLVGQIIIIIITIIIEVAIVKIDCYANISGLFYIRVIVALNLMHQTFKQI